jgi:integrase
MMGLRKGELASVRFRDFDLGRRRLRVHGKGGKIRQTPIPTEELRQEIATVALRRDPVEHLLYPEKRGPGGRLLWEDRRKPLSGPAMHRWWYRCLTRAGVVAEGTTSGKKIVRPPSIWSRASEGPANFESLNGGGYAGEALQRGADRGQAA